MANCWTNSSNASNAAALISQGRRVINSEDFEDLADMIVTAGKCDVNDKH